MKYILFLYELTLFINYVLHVHSFTTAKAPYISHGQGSNLPQSRVRISVRLNNDVVQNPSTQEDVNKIVKKDRFFTDLLERFQGDFDNYEQVYEDRQKGMPPKEGGGHEHFHVTLLPIDTKILPQKLFSEFDESEGRRIGAVLASYYFNGIPSKIFRLRLYTFMENDNEEDQIEMKLYTLNPALEGLLRQNCKKSLSSWGNLLENHCDYLGDNDDFSSFCTELKRCDILWTRKPDPVRHSYFNENGDERGDKVHSDPYDAFHAIMLNDHEIGGVLLESQMIPGLQLRIQDELSLWENELWVNDRGFNAETGDMVYGNYLSIPYKMKRVAILEPSEDGFCRKIVDSTLGWTLGDHFRTNEEYQSKMEKIGISG